MYKRILTSALVFGMVAMPPPLGAQGLCAPREIIADQLQRDFGESALVQGLAGVQHLYEFWAAPDGAGWTLLVTLVNGQTCVLATGTGWWPGPAPQRSAPADAAG